MSHLHERESCPTQAKLRQFALGNLPGTEIETIAEHIESCAVCETALADFDDADDALITNLKQTQRDIDPGAAYARRLADGPVRIGKFERLSELGDGSFGYVFRARDTELDRDVAVKVGRAGSLASEEEIDAFLGKCRSDKRRICIAFSALHSAPWRARITRSQRTWSSPSAVAGAGDL